MYTLDDVSHLNLSRWEAAQARAREMVTHRLTRPDRAQFLRRSNPYPPAFTALVFGLLVVVALAAFLISAGKQVVAYDAITAYLYQDHAALIGAGYHAVTTLAFLTLGEFGVLLFGLVAFTVPDRVTATRFLRLFQAASVSLALVANISITATNIDRRMPVFDWLVTVVAPLLVVGIGVVIEVLAHGWITARRAALQAYEAALAAYEAVVREPTQHAAYEDALGQQIFEQLCRVSARNRTVIEALLEDDPQAKVTLALREWSRFQWSFKAALAAPDARAAVKRDAREAPAARDSRAAPAPSEAVDAVPQYLPGESARQAARRLIAADATLMQFSTRELARRTGISASAWQRALADLRAEASAA